MKLLNLSILFLLLAIHAQAGSFEDWIKLEQTRIDRTVDEKKIKAPTIAAQAVEYRPESETWFPLKSIWIPEEELHSAVQEEALPAEVKKLFVKTRNGKKYFRLLIHPESENFYAALLKKYRVEKTAFEATSTASSRTLVVRHKATKQRMFVKLSLDVNLGGVVRTVPAGEVARSVGTSRYLAAYESQHPGVFTFMREALGISPKGWERGGMILRLPPENVMADKVSLVPLFSLYAKGPNGEPSLLKTMADKAQISPAQFMREKILEPFYEGWVDWNVNAATTMEAHAQNVLLEVGPDGQPTGRFVHRDLGGFNIDTHSPLYEERAPLDVFTTLEKDYHQEFTGSARAQSLYTYFDGGFLYNVDLELTKIDPSYKPGSIKADGYKILANKFKLLTGHELSDAALLELAKFNNKMSDEISAAAKLVKENPKPGFATTSAIRPNACGPNYARIHH